MQVQQVELAKLKKSLTGINDVLLNVKKELDGKDAILIKLKQELEFLTNKSKENENLFLISEKSKIVLKKILSDTRESVLLFIEGVVTSALREVFDNMDISFKFRLKLDGSRNALECFIIENGYEYDMLNSRGGGVVDVVSVALQICFLYIYKNKIKFPLLLDERLKFLHSIGENDYNKNAYRFLSNVCKKLDQQIIMITGRKNDNAISLADNILVVNKKNGESEVCDYAD